MLTFKEASAQPRVIKAVSGGVKLEKAGDGRYALTVPAAEFAIIQY